MMKLSTPLQIVIAVILGAMVGRVFPPEQLLVLSELGKIFIHWVKLIAGPFLFCTILIAIIQVDIKWQHGVRLLGIALLNTTMALLLSVILASVFFKNASLPSSIHPSVSSSVPLAQNQNQFNLKSSIKDQTSIKLKTADPQDKKSAFSLTEVSKTFMPSSILAPFVDNNILFIALLALVLGIAVRASETVTTNSRQSLIGFMLQLQSALAVILHWIIRTIPFAVFAIIAATVSKFGFDVFYSLAKFVSVITLGFVLQIILVYGFWIFFIAKIPYKVFIKYAKEPVLYALGVNSSLATLPLTLMALKKLKVSDRSASLGAGVATNLNNDGIILYEAMAIMFILNIYNLPTDPYQLMVVAMTCIVASIGITGIPEAGFISLSVIVGVLGLPLEVLPLLLSVDWILARFRSVVNVLSDITLAVAMDATDIKS